MKRLIVALLLLAEAATACTPPNIKPSPRIVIGQTAIPDATKAAFETLDVKGRAPKTGYSRDKFGPAWQDVDRNGCDTRNDILARDLYNVAKSGKCKVVSGILADPYTGTTITWKYGTTTSTAIQIDHVVALGNAWVTGAAYWTDAKRLQYANDPVVLHAVSGPQNEAKGDGDAATWLPPNRKDWCDYVSQQITIKAKYGLWVTSAEHDAMVRVTQSCG